MIEAARSFAEHQQGAGRPRPVWLRRAVSSAYYALYHRLTIGTAAHTLQTAGGEQDMLRMTRAFGHRAMKESCEWVAGRRRPSKIPREVRGLVESLRHTPIEDLAASFCDLQEARHRADYDHLARFSKAETVSHIDEAENAIKALAEADEAARDSLFALLALGTRITSTQAR